LVAPSGAYSRVLVPGGVLTRYQNANFRAPLAKGTSCCCSVLAAQYRLQQQRVPLARTFGPFSSSAD